MIAALAAPLLLASTALAHIQINYPLVRRPALPSSAPGRHRLTQTAFLSLRQGQRSFEEETQETGAFCGGGAYSNGASDALSFAGDRGAPVD